MSNRRSLRLAAGMLVTALWVLSAPGALGQSDDPSAGEVSALGGATLGGIGTRPTVTGGAGVAFSRYGMALVETTFLPLGDHTIQNWPARNTVDRSYLLDFGVDFHIRVPITYRFAPYGIAGTGLLWNFFRQDTFTRTGVPLTRHFSQFNGALHTGGGVRYYIRENWGIRPEVKVIVSKQVYTTISLGIFYVTPPNWP
jgi:hypothetical protein